MNLSMRSLQSPVSQRAVTPEIPCKIGFMGSKAVGKTTVANLLNGHLKAIGAHSDMVYETARNCPFLLNEKTGIASSYWIVGEQIAAEALVEAKRQFTICDRTIIDVLSFAVCGLVRMFSIKHEDAHKSDEINVLKQIIKIYLEARPYDFLFYVPVRQELWSSFFKPEDYDFQLEIDRELRVLLAELNVPYYELQQLTGNGRIEEIMTQLREHYQFSLASNQVNYTVIELPNK